MNTGATALRPLWESDDVMVRSVSFFADASQLAAVERRIKHDVIPRFSVFPEFLGFVALRSVGRRSEIVAMSFWERGLDTSEAISENFRDEIERVTGTMPSRRQYGVIASVWRWRGKSSSDGASPPPPADP